MQVADLLAEDNAVSPVVGVVLMVAVTVILAAVVGTFVLGIGGDQSDIPQGSFTFDYAQNDTLIISHAGGDRYTDRNTGNLTVKYTNTTGSDPSDYNWPLPTEAGDEINVKNSGGGSISAKPTDGDRVRVVWVSPSGGSTQTVSATELPP